MKLKIYLYTISQRSELVVPALIFIQCSVLVEKIASDGIISIEELFFIDSSNLYNGTFTLLVKDESGLISKTFFDFVWGIPYIFIDLLFNVVGLESFQKYYSKIFLVFSLWMTVLYKFFRSFNIDKLLSVLASSFVVTSLWFLTSWASVSKVMQVVVFCLGYLFLDSYLKTGKVRFLFQLVFLGFLTISLAFNLTQLLFALLYIPLGYFLNYRSLSMKIRYRKIKIFVSTLPQLLSIFSYFLFPYSSIYKITDWVAIDTDLTKLAFLRGAWWEESGYFYNDKPYKYTDWIQLYYQNMFEYGRLIVVFAVFIGSLLILLLRKSQKINRKNEYFLILSMTILLLMFVSGSSVFPNLREILLEYRFLLAFREPWAKAMPILTILLVLLFLLFTKMFILQSPNQKNIIRLMIIFSLISGPMQVIFADSLAPSISAPLMITSEDQASIDEKILDVNKSKSKTVCVFFDNDLRSLIYLKSILPIIRTPVVGIIKKTNYAYPSQCLKSKNLLIIKGDLSW